MSLRAVLGSFSLLRLRARIVGQPGLTVYADAGISAAVEMGGKVRDLSHANEVSQLELAGKISAMVADKRIDPAELAELMRVPGSLARCADRSHQIGQIIKL